MASQLKMEILNEKCEELKAAGLIKLAPPNTQYAWAWAACLGPAFMGGYFFFSASALAVWKFGWDFPDVLLVSLPLVGVWHAVLRMNVPPFPLLMRCSTARAVLFV